MAKQRNTAVHGRRPTQAQGRALEILGHAIEYLIDSYVVVTSEYGGIAMTEAVQTLMKLNMAVYGECQEIIPVTQRLRARIVNTVLFTRS